MDQELLLDQLAATITREKRSYQFSNYASEVSGDELNVPSPLSVVEQCAMIVSEVPFTPEYPSQSRGLLSPVSVLDFPQQRSGHGEKPLWTLSLGESRTCGLISQSEGTRLAKWRREMLGWMNGVLDKYSLSREVAAVTFHLMDRFVASEVSSQAYFETPITEQDFQLYSMVCMYIAIKDMVPCRKLTPGCIVEMTGGFYSKEHVEEAELDILATLEWYVHPPTVLEYSRLFINLFPPSIEVDKILRYCNFLSELMLKDVQFIGCPVSLCALAATLLAAQRNGSTSQEVTVFLGNLKDLVSVASDDFDRILGRLETLC